LQPVSEQLALFFQLLATGFQGLLGGPLFGEKGIASAADLGELVAGELFQSLPFRLQERERTARRGRLIRSRRTGPGSWGART
jgi:hypothetical protein